MIDLNAMALFVAVVRAGGFSAAARALELPKSSVSRQISALERRLGVGLLRRSTRALSELCWNLGDAVIRRRSVLAC